MVTLDNDRQFYLLTIDNVFVYEEWTYSKLATHPKVSVLPVVVPHVIVHDFIEAVTDVVTPEHVHGTLGVKICNNQSIDNDYPYLSINQ